MKNIRPESFEVADLTSNVAITDTEWTAGTYDTGDQRYVGKDLYEVVATPNTAQEPTAGVNADPPTWVKIGQINRWRMFNNALYQTTDQTGGPITVTLETTGLVDAIAVLKCVATEAVVTVTDATDGEVYNRTVPLVNNDGIADVYDYFFAPIDRKSEFVLLDLPPYAGTSIEVKLDAGTEDTSCGALVLGQQTRFGSTYMTFNIRNRFFTNRERTVFGNFLDVPSRPVAREAMFDVLILKDAVTQVMDLINERRDVPTVFVGDGEYEHSIVFGFPDEPEVEQIAPDWARLYLTVLGLT